MAIKAIVLRTEIEETIEIEGQDRVIIVIIEITETIEITGTIATTGTDVTIEIASKVTESLITTIEDHEQTTTRNATPMRTTISTSRAIARMVDRISILWIIPGRSGLIADRITRPEKVRIRTTSPI
jgi:hypothetical protein